MIEINVDEKWRELAEKELRRSGRLGTIPKPFGAPGLTITPRSFNDEPDKLVDPKDYKEVISRSISDLVFPQFHQERSWAPKGFKWNQNGLPYCWAWSLTAAIMDTEAREAQEGEPSKLLAPVSMGGAVKWANTGNYLENAIQWAIDHGVASAEYVPSSAWFSRNPNSFKSGWEQDALNHKIDPQAVWQMDNSSKTSMVQHCITNLSRGNAVYLAYYWWSHALEMIGLIWDETQKYNLKFVIRNSHDESEPIILTGDRAVPDEAFGILGTMPYVS